MSTSNHVPLIIDVLSDVVCPWCFIGKRRLETALELFKEKYPNEPTPLVRWSAFQLNPDLPLVGIERSQYLREKFGDRAPSVYERVSGVGQAVGIDFKFDQIKRQPNTLFAHSLIAQAQTPAEQAVLVEVLFKAYFLDAMDLTDKNVLTQLAQLAGMSDQAIQEGLANSEAHQAVLEKEKAARELGINGVPFYILNSQFGVSGAQEPETLLEAMGQAIKESESV
ncbi:MAG: DsbA family oxidoreductase [Betaproteobacteria bacterium]|jgi:predicted DsbA family dithiol-disulfide isomerase